MNSGVCLPLRELCPYVLRTKEQNHCIAKKKYFVLNQTTSKNEYTKL
jgi:hypothetical protein